MQDGGYMIGGRRCLQRLFDFLSIFSVEKFDPAYFDPANKA